MGFISEDEIRNLLKTTPGSTLGNVADKLKLIQESQDRRKITGEIGSSYYGLEGCCVSQPEEFAKSLCDECSDKFYDDNSEAHELGQHTVDIVLSALNAVPNVRAWQTPSNSTADVSWKWDIIIEHENYLYPVQVKSKFSDIEDCKLKFEHTLESHSEKIEEEVSNIENRFYELEERMEERWERHSRLRDNDQLQKMIEVRDSRIKQFRAIQSWHLGAEPIYLWVSRDHGINAVQELAAVFAELFTINFNLVDIQQQAIKNYRSKHKTIRQLLIEEENSKLEKLQEIKELLEGQLDRRNNILSRARKVLRIKDKPIALEKIIAVKIVENTLEIIQENLKQSQTLQEALQNSYESEKVPQLSSSIERQKRLMKHQLQARKRRRRNIRQRRNTVLQESEGNTSTVKNTELSELIPKLHKLIELDQTRDSSLLESTQDLLKIVACFFQGGIEEDLIGIVPPTSSPMIELLEPSDLFNPSDLIDLDPDEII